MTTFTVKKHTFQSAAVATGNGTAMVVAGLAALGIQVEGITTATITFEGTIDGATWYAVEARNVTSGAIATTTTADGLFVADVAGLEQFRARLTWTVGTVTVTGRATSSAGGLGLASSAAGIVSADVTDRAARDLGKVDIAAFDVALPAGAAHLGQVGGEGITIALTPAITAGAYSAGDAVGGLLTFANAGRASAEGSVLTDVLIVDDAGQDAELELWLFNQTFTAMADNAAWAPSEADLENCIAVVSTVGSTWRAAGTPSVINIECTRRLDITGTSLFGQLVTRGTPTYAAVDDLTVKVKLLQD